MKEREKGYFQKTKKKTRYTLQENYYDDTSNMEAWVWEFYKRRSL